MSAHCKKVVIALLFIVACSSVVKAEDTVEDTVIDREELHIKVQNICPVSWLVVVVDLLVFVAEHCIY